MTDICELCKLPMDQHEVGQIVEVKNSKRVLVPVGWVCPTATPYFSRLLPTIRDKSRALDILRNSVHIVLHVYEKDPFSGAGNCWCGRPDVSSIHRVYTDG